MVGSGKAGQACQVELRSGKVGADRRGWRGRHGIFGG